MVLVVAGWRAYGWGGVAIAVTGLVMWMLLHFNRLTHVLKRAAERPVGFVGSAVMLNARLKPGVNLLHVIAMTQALGELLSVKDEQPEVYRWTDAARPPCHLRIHQRQAGRSGRFSGRPAPEESSGLRPAP